MSSDNAAATTAAQSSSEATGGGGGASNGGGTRAGGGGAGGGGLDAGAQANRSIVVDAAFFEEQFLRCQVCQERFHETERPPKSLPCNHTFCVPCLTQIFNHAQPQSRRNLLWADEAMDGPLKCPTCRVEIFVSKNKIKDLPNDHRVVQMIDFLSQAVTTTQNVCTKHERQPLNFFCKKCLLPVCRDCTVLDHKEQQGHAIVDVKEALSDRSGEFNQMEEKCRQTLERMKARSDSLANASKRLDIQETQLRNEIKDTFIEYRLLLEKRQEALTVDLQQRIRDQKALINTRFVHVCEHGTQLQKLFDSFSKAKSSNDVEQLFNLHKDMKDHEDQFNSVAVADDNELFKSCTFDSTSEGEFLSGISSLGEVGTRDDPTLKETVSPHQLLYLDNESRRERERLLQYAEMADPGEEEMEDPDRDMEEAYNIRDMVMMRDHDTSSRSQRYQPETNEDYLRMIMRDPDVSPRSQPNQSEAGGDYMRMLYRRAMIDQRGSSRDSREEMDEGESEHHIGRPTHPRRRPRTSGSSPLPASSIAAQLAMFSPLVLGGGDSSSSSGNSRSGSRSRRREAGSGSSGSAVRGYRVERHTHNPASGGESN